MKNHRMDLYSRKVLHTIREKFVIRHCISFSTFYPATYNLSIFFKRIDQLRDIKRFTMPTIHQWLSQYGESHQNHTNKTIHWICVPAIFFSIVSLLYGIKLPFFIAGHHINVAMIVLVLVIAYYFSLSKTLWIGMFLFGTLCLLLCHFIEIRFFIPLWAFSLIIFAAAWIGQFYGHKVEGKKPSFLKDLQFLMIGPAWLMSFIYQRLCVKL